MIRSLLISGFLDDARLTRVLGEILDIGVAAAPDEKLVIVFESEGGALGATVSFLECVTGDESTRTLIEQAEVKIYQAWSGAALLAFSMGSRREMEADARICFHLPLLKLRYWQVDGDRRVRIPGVAEECRKYNTQLARLLVRHELDQPEFTDELNSTGYLYLSAEECLRRGLVHEIF